MSTSPGADPQDSPTESLDDPKEGAEQEEPTPQELKAQLREEKRAREAAAALAEERKATIEFWKKREEREAARPAPVPNAPKVAEPEPLENLDLLALLTEAQTADEVKKVFTKAVKAQIAHELKGGGYVSKEEVEQHIAGIVNSATAMSNLVNDFPGLGDPKSDFFAETQKQLATMRDDPSNNGIPEGKLYRMAALEAKAALIDSGKYQKESTDDRYARIANQRGGSRGKEQGGSSDTGLTAGQRAMAAKFGLTDKQYLEGRSATRLGPGLTADQIMRELRNG